MAVQPVPTAVPPKASSYKPLSASFRDLSRGRAGKRSRKLLPQSQRRRILQVGAADFDDRGEFFGFFVQCIAQGFYRRNKVAVDFNRSGDVDGGWERVIGRLRVVHMVVGMDGLIRCQAHTGNFVGAVRQYFVHVHIGLRAGAGLPYY